MKFNLFKSESNLAFPRCEHRSPSGRQCSQPVCSTDPRFCGTHKPTPEQLATVELTEAAGTLSSPGEVHRFLKAVLLNRVRGRITPKEAAVYSYLCQNLLRSLREIDHFHELQSERAERNLPPELMWHLPRPDRSDPPEPVAQTPENSTTNSTPACPESDRRACPESDRRACPEHREGSPTTTNSTPIESPALALTTTEGPALSLTEAKIPAASAPSKPAISIIPPTPNPPFDPRHFYPLDPTLPRGAQDHSRNIPPPDEVECRRLAARRGLPFKLRRPVHTGAQQ